MRNILEAEMTETHGVRVMYAQGIVALSPYLEDPYSQHGYEHYYDPESGSGYLEWSSTAMQRKAAEERSVSVCKSPKIGGPGHGRSRPLTTQTVLSDEDVRAAIALLRQSADEDIREKMKATFIYRHSMVNDEKNAADVFIGLMRFLDTPGLTEQDFRLLFCEVTASKSLERWPINLKAKAGTGTCLLSCCCYICYHHLHKGERDQERCLHLKLLITSSNSQRLEPVYSSI
ncbi:uncharacterized protein LOC116309237 isoform X1 [Oreochromis aureus]|uniref:uncharacterized protein LOC116309237 isoform X1 n=3 Tax=Oreochromis aureus TaxID=47969 RepID=UPI0019536B23|nr:uncharacterized protein LOC116309237 isoform X1 [Oreochromis aureus]XP_039463265.1 uncharacterized protein LOC116309237 isoform X1 [Oreochromis aureus]